MRKIICIGLLMMSMSSEASSLQIQYVSEFESMCVGGTCNSIQPTAGEYIDFKKICSIFDNGKVVVDAMQTVKYTPNSNYNSSVTNKPPFLVSYTTFNTIQFKIGVLKDLVLNTQAPSVNSDYTDNKLYVYKNGQKVLVNSYRPSFISYTPSLVYQGVWTNQNSLLTKLIENVCDFKY